MTWDLSKYDGIRLALGKSDGKKYTFNLKDESLPQRPDGREQSTISWEYDFDGKDKNIFIPWSELKPTYRGRPKTDAEPLNLKSVQRISLMMRRYVDQVLSNFSHS